MLAPKDRDIIRELSANSDRPRKSLSLILGISEPSLSKRIAGLIALGIIKRFTIDVKYEDENIGYSIHAFSLVKLKDQDTAQSTDLVNRIRSTNEAVEVYTTFGEWDLYVRWMCKNNTDLMGAISNLLRDKNVAHVETVTLAKEHKRERGPTLQPMT